MRGVNNHTFIFLTCNHHHQYPIGSTYICHIDTKKKKKQEKHKQVTLVERFPNSIYVCFLSWKALVAFFLFIKRFLKRQSLLRYSTLCRIDTEPHPLPPPIFFHLSFNIYERRSYNLLYNHNNLRLLLVNLFGLLNYKLC